VSDTSGDTEPELLESADVARAAPGVIRESVVERSSEPPPPATEGRRCPHCGSLLRRGTSNELCSVCLLFGMRRGKRVGDYFLDDELPGGGMGEIHLATHVDTNVSVAIKFPRPEVLATPDGAASFRNEIKAASRLKHPNIARVFHSAWQPERPYFVMEFLEGGTLEDPVNIARHRSTRGAAELVSTIADAVQARATGRRGAGGAGPAPGAPTARRREPAGPQ
jgi:hypothetical protein